MPDSTGTSPTHIARLVREAVPPMHPGGRPIVAGVGLAAAGLRLLTGRGTATRLIATAAVAAPIVVAADGTVATVVEVVPPPELDLPREPCVRVSVFLSLLDVHVQWVPVHGRVRAVEYSPGAFLSADLDKASEDNERNAITLETAGGQRVGVVQIAGLLARRIVCPLAAGDEVAAGERFGLIRFGSRVDTYLPPGATALVAPGQRSVGAETVLAELPPPAGAERGPAA